MRSILPWLAALAPTAASYSFPQLQVLTPRQVGEPGGPHSETPSNSSSAPVNQANFEQDKFGESSTKLSFAITIHPSSGDLRFRMAGPSMYSWVAFGIGPSMKGSLMFIMHRSSQKDGTHLSGRLAEGNLEPSHSKTINLTSIEPIIGDRANGVNNTNDMMYQTGICKACMELAPNKLDPNSTAQPFIFAVGPRNPDYFSDRDDAPLRRHWHYGHFKLDLSKALGVGIPTLQFDIVEKTGITGFTLSRDSNFAESAHVFVMVLTFVIIIPLGIFFVRSLEKVSLHMILQAAALVLVIVGFATGLIISKLYNRSQKINSIHQIIGILVFIFILAQWAFGFVSHQRYKKTGYAIKWMMSAHKLVLGPIVFALGIINISIGFKFAQANRLNWVYLPVIFIVIILLALSSFYKNWFMSKWGNKNNGASRTYNNGPYGPQTTGLEPGYAGGPFATRSDIALSPMDNPPAYESKPTRPREFA